MSEFALEDINETEESSEVARLRVEEYQALVTSLAGKLHLHDLTGVASKLMDNWTSECGVLGHTYNGKEITGDIYYYHDWQIEKINGTWVFEDISMNGTSQMFTDPSPSQGMKAVDVMMKNEGVA